MRQISNRCERSYREWLLRRWNKGILNQFVEVMAAVGEKEREDMLGRHEAGMPMELGEVYVAASKTAIEKVVRERE